jgi:hypothetical protein
MVCRAPHRAPRLQPARQPVPSPLPRVVSTPVRELHATMLAECPAVRSDWGKVGSRRSPAPAAACATGEWTTTAHASLLAHACPPIASLVFGDGEATRLRSAVCVRRVPPVPRRLGRRPKQTKKSVAASQLRNPTEFPLKVKRPLCSGPCGAAGARKCHKDHAIHVPFSINCQHITVRRGTLCACARPVRLAVANHSSCATNVVALAGATPCFLFSWFVCRFPAARGLRTWHIHRSRDEWPPKQQGAGTLAMGAPVRAVRRFSSGRFPAGWRGRRGRADVR